MAEWIYCRMKTMGVFAAFFRKSQERMKRLYPGQDWQTQLERYYKETIRLVLKIAAVGLVLLPTCLWYEGCAGGKEIRLLERNAYGGGTGQEEVTVHGEDGFSAEYLLEIREREFAATEIQQLFAEIRPRLESMIPGANPSLHQVEADLCLPEAVEGYPFEIQWHSSDTGVINSAGEVLREYRTEPVKVMLTSILEYELFEGSYDWEVTVLPGQWSREEIWKYYVEQAIRQSDAESVQKEEWVLPETVDGGALCWRQKKPYYGVKLAALLGIGILLVIWGRNNDLQRQWKQRDRMLEEEYSLVVTKLTLYLGAGMTVKNAWKKALQIQLQHDQRSVVAAEMRLVLREMNSGVFETLCYENFGQRCGRREYIKLGTLLSQTLRKGNNELLSRLREEVLTAGENKKHLVRRRGEEASTKLIVPMVLLLGISMVLIMVPAFMGIG